MIKRIWKWLIADFDARFLALILLLITIIISYQIVIFKKHIAMENFSPLVIKFVGTFVAIAIPISLSIVSNNLKDYRDKNIAKMFREELVYQFQLYFIIPTIGIILTCIYVKVPIYIVDFLSIILLVTAVLLFILYIRLIEKYSTDLDDTILNKAKKELEQELQELKKQKKYNEKQLFKPLEQIIKVLEKKLETGQDEEVKEVFLYCIDKFKIYEEAKPFSNTNNYFLSIGNNYIKNDSYSPLLDSPNFAKNSYLPRLTPFGNILYNIWEKIYKTEKFLLSKIYLENLNELVEYYLDKENKGDTIKYLLAVFHQIVENGIKTKDDDKKATLNIIIYEWYLNHKYKNSNKLRYTTELEAAFFKIFQLIIDKNEENIFQSFIKNTANSLLTLNTSNELKGIIPVDEKYIQLQRECEKIYNLGKLNYTPFDFEQWQKKFKTFKDNLTNQLKNDKHFNEDFEKKIELFKKRALQHFHKNNLSLRLFFIGSYCLFAERFDLIKYKLSYCHPKGNQLYHVNKDINPSSFEDMLQIFYMLSREISEMRIDFIWKDRHDFCKYIYPYCSIIIAYDAEGNFEKNRIQPQLFKLYDAESIAQLKDKFKSLLIYSKEIVKNKELLKNLGIKDVKADNLASLYQSLTERINMYEKETILMTESDGGLVNNLKENVINGFKENATFRKLFEIYSNKKKPFINTLSPEKFKMSTEQLFDRKIFIKDWSYINYTSGSFCGENVARLENNSLLDQIYQHCKPAGYSIKDWLVNNSNHLDEYILISNKTRVRDILSHRVALPEDCQIDIKDYDIIKEKIGLKGLYKKKLELYEVQCNSLPNYIIILEKKNFSNHVQYIPTLDKKLEDYKIFDENKNWMFFRLVPFRGNLVLTKDYEQKNPKINELELKALLQFWIKSQFKPSKNFNGIFF